MRIYKSWVLRAIFLAACLAALSSSVPGAAPALAQRLSYTPDVKCGETIRCPVENGGYLVKAPKGWNGKTPLPTLLYFHGYQESAESVMASRDFIDFADSQGILLVAPHGQGQTWSYPGSPANYRDEFAFVRAVLADIERRYPIRHNQLWASGFSQGGSMVWYLACVMGDRFAAFAPISGAFWLPMPTSCRSGPINMRHIHGLNDDTVPMRGRAIGFRFRQGDVREGLGVLREANGCKAEPVSRTRESDMQCEAWTSCSSGKSLKLCLHPDGHSVETPHLEASWTWVKSLSR